MDLILVESEPFKTQNESSTTNYDEIVLIKETNAEKEKQQRSQINDVEEVRPSTSRAADADKTEANTRLVEANALSNSNRPSSNSNSSSKTKLNNTITNSTNLNSNSNQNDNKNLQLLDSKTVSMLLNKINGIFLLIVVPFFLFLCIILKINFQSLVYLFLLFLMPFMYPINEHTINRKFKMLTKALLFFMPTE